MSGAAAELGELAASLDELSGELYVPSRRYAADGSLRPCTPTTVPAVGVLVSWTKFEGQHYGLVDLDASPRVQAFLAEGPHEVGARYHGHQDSDGTLRFVRD
ncbi:MULTISPECIES: hypothetical protein [unclassified Mycobacterium]|uniref:hypothetical protein n=1 Tax=unclassified Mycobacterium TaxID=2642494 RepID=UPI0029C90E25|nr:MULTISPECIES: hypothetical protein [unclassified Mycobacterium]